MPWFSTTFLMLMILETEPIEPTRDYSSAYTLDPDINI